MRLVRTRRFFQRTISVQMYVEILDPLFESLTFPSRSISCHQQPHPANQLKEETGLVNFGRSNWHLHHPSVALCISLIDRRSDGILGCSASGGRAWRISSVNGTLEAAKQTPTWPNQITGLIVASMDYLTCI